MNVPLELIIVISTQHVKISLENSLVTVISIILETGKNVNLTQSTSALMIPVRAALMKAVTTKTSGTSATASPDIHVTHLMITLVPISMNVPLKIIALNTPAA